MWTFTSRPKRHGISRRAVIVAVPSVAVLAIVVDLVLNAAWGNSAPLRCFYRSGKASLRACDDVIASDWSPAIRAEAHYNRGVELDRLRRPAEALLSYEEAVRLKPDYAAAYSNMGITLVELGRWDDALRAYRAAIDAKPQYADAHYNLGVALLDLRHWEEALDAFREAVRLNPRDAQALYNAGVTLNFLRRHDEALQAYGAAVHARPGYAQAWGNLGMTAYLLDRDGEALEAFDRARRLQPSYFENREIQRNAWEEIRSGQRSGPRRSVPRENGAARQQSLPSASRS